MIADPVAPVEDLTSELLGARPVQVLSHYKECGDDAALVERLGETVHVIDGDARNLKITTPADLELARAIIRP